jgi:hypothetical protein
VVIRSVSWKVGPDTVSRLGSIERNKEKDTHARIAPSVPIATMRALETALTVSGAALSVPQASQCGAVGVSPEIKRKHAA